MRQFDSINLRSEIRLLHRYNKPVWILVMLLGTVLLWYWLQRSHELAAGFNPALLMSFLALSFFGLFFQDFFWGGKNERLFRFLSPLNLDAFVVAKNATILLTFAVFAVLLFVLIGFLLSPSSRELWNAILYLGTSMVVFLHMGNYAASGSRALYASGKGVLFMARYGLMVFVAALPYIVLKVIIGSYVLCVIFILLAAVSWYFVSVPRTAKRLDSEKYELLRPE